MLYKCKNCGGELHFDPAIGKLKCKYCDTEYDVSEYQQDEPLNTAADQKAQEADALQKGFDRATDDTTDIKEDLKLYQCPHCQAEVVTDKTTSATNCVFCNTPLVLQEQIEGEFKPDKLIPFAVDQKQIENLYENYIRNKPFYPEEYSKANVIEKIKSVYLPFWLYDLHTTGNLKATGERTSTYTTRDWIVTNHDVYSLLRGGSMDFKRIPVIASSKTPKNAMDSIEPYDYSKLVDFNTGYLPGFLAERYDASMSSCQKDAANRAANSFDSRLSSTIGGYSNVKIQGGDMNHTQTDGQYALLPAYILFMDYDNDEDKLIAINGQTGKIVGNIPIDKNKRNRFFLIRFILIWLVLFVVMMGIFLFM